MMWLRCSGFSSTDDKRGGWSGVNQLRRNCFNSGEHFAREMFLVAQFCKQLYINNNKISEFKVVVIHLNLVNPLNAPI